MRLLHRSSVRGTETGDAEGKIIAQVLTRLNPQVRRHLQAQAERVGRPVEEEALRLALSGIRAYINQEKLRKGWTNLTNDEQTVCRLLGLGLPPEAIAHRLDTSPREVEARIARGLAKLRICSARELQHAFRDEILRQYLLDRPCSGPDRV